MFHTHDAFKSFLVDMLEDILVIHLSSGRFLATWVIADLEVTDFIPCSVDIPDDIPLIALHMVHIEQDLAGRAVHGAADHVSLCGISQE